MDVKVIQIDGGTNVEETMSKDSPKSSKNGEKYSENF